MTYCIIKSYTKTKSSWRESPSTETMKAKIKNQWQTQWFTKKNHPWLLKLIKNSSFSTDDFMRLLISWTRRQWQKKPLYAAVKMPDPICSSPDSNSIEFSGGSLDFSSSSSIIISKARQVKLQNAFSPLQDIKQNKPILVSCFIHQINF